jgi:hypothetical protein
MHRLRTGLAAIVLAAAALAGPATTASGAEPADLGADAVWAWWWPTDAALLREVEGYGFSRVYLFAEGGFGTKVRAAIAALRAHGIEVEALGLGALAGTRRPEQDEVQLLHEAAEPTYFKKPS